jgi:multidrug efflux system membrane fusion protein
MPPIVSQVNEAAREVVGDLEHRVGGKRRLHIIFAVVGVALLVLLVRGFGGKSKTQTAPPPRQVIVAKVTTADVPLYLDEIGTTAAYETVEIKAQVTGQIISRDFKDGADVIKGDLLFRIDPRPYEAALTSAQADKQLNEANFRRQAELRAKNVTATQDLDTAQANAMKGDAAVKAAQVNLDFCSIRSPIDGRVGLRNVDVGNVVNPGSPSLVTIQGLDPIYTDFTIAEPDLPLVRKYLGNPKLKVVTDAENDNVPPRTGELYFIDNAVQPGVGTVKARATTPNPDRALWPSQFVHVRLILDEIPGAKLVPASAVQIGQNGPYVFVVKPDSTLDLRKVNPGQEQGDLVVIQDGLQPGETVVVSGQLQLAPGAKVVTKPTDQPAKGLDAALAPAGTATPSGTASSASAASPAK